MTDLSNFVVEHGFWLPNEAPEQAIYRMSKDLRRRYGKHPFLFLVEQFPLRAWEVEKRLSALRQALAGTMEDELIHDVTWQQLTTEEEEALGEVGYRKLRYPEDVDSLARLCVESRETHVMRATPLPLDYQARLQTWLAERYPENP